MAVASGWFFSLAGIPDSGRLKSKPAGRQNEYLLRILSRRG